MPEPLASQFANAATAAHDAFPEVLKRLVVVARTFDTPVYVAPEIAEHLTRNLEEVKQSVKAAAETLHQRNAGGIAMRFRSIAGEPVRMIALDDAPAGVFSGGYTSEMRANYILDHELGHYVVKGGFAGGHAGEAAADAFATLRHIQRYGLNQDFFDYNNKALPLVLAQSPIHYTTGVLRHVHQLAQQRDVTQLSLAETAALAEEIAQQHALSPSVMTKVTNAFADAGAAYLAAYGSQQAVKDKLYQQDKDAYALFVRETMKVQNSTTDPDIRAAIDEFFRYPPMMRFLAENTPGPKPTPVPKP
ncbi:MAG TPA: hypothetical protein VEF76_05600 [Patescibacteria group bacterium]|nr:hypothetical protein [Patescibacteria group bacterium]